MAQQSFSESSKTAQTYGQANASWFTSEREEHSAKDLRQLRRTSNKKWRNSLQGSDFKHNSYGALVTPLVAPIRNPYQPIEAESGANKEASLRQQACSVMLNRELGFRRRSPPKYHSKAVRQEYALTRDHFITRARPTQHTKGAKRRGKGVLQSPFMSVKGFKNFRHNCKG